MNNSHEDWGSEATENARAKPKGAKRPSQRAGKSAANVGASWQSVALKWTEGAQIYDGTMVLGKIDCPCHNCGYVNESGYLYTTFIRSVVKNNRNGVTMVSLLLIFMKF